MKLIVLKDAEAVAQQALEIVCQKVSADPRCVIGYPTGNSVERLYASLRAEARGGALDLSQTRAVQLDELLGLPEGDPRSFFAQLYEKVLEPCGIKASNTLRFKSAGTFLEADGRSYDAQIAAMGGVGLQILGIGANGHIGFNEPASAFSQGTHRVRLSEETRTAMRAQFEPDLSAPCEAVTMGVALIAKAQEILLLATGPSKAKAIADMIKGPARPACPASALSEHPCFTVLLDHSAAASL